MNNYYLSNFMLLAAISLSAFACFDKCNLDTDEYKCDGNRLMFCENAEGAGRWVESKNCDDFNATCQKGSYVLFGGTKPPYDQYIRTHGCALDTIACDGDTDYQCSPDQQMIAACSYSDEPTAMLVDINREDRPFCVEKSDGTAFFALLEDECTTGESMCADNPEHAYICEYGVWALNQTNFCDFERQNYACVDDTDSNGNADASCEFADPCDDSTGEYRICRDESSIFDCFFSESLGVWTWQATTCYSGGVCEVQDDGTGDCQ